MAVRVRVIINALLYQQQENFENIHKTLAKLLEIRCKFLGIENLARAFPCTVKKCLDSLCTVMGGKGDG